MNRSMWRKFVVFGVALLLSTMAVAQEETGNIYIQVTDTAGQTLPGVNVEMTGGGAPKLGITNAQGETRFLGLSPGNYSLTATLDGFSTVEYPSVNVRVGKNTTIQVQLSAAIGEVITVTSESPLLDERKLTAGTTISQVELESIPSARDPWAIVQQSAGVMTDRINVGGNESGQQAVFRGQANNGDENDFLVDGVQITDMSAVGSSPTYYDFDQFQEIQLATGGPDVSKGAAGVSVNMVTKRGTNEFRGSARFLLTDDSGYFGALEAADPGFSQSDLGPGQDNYRGDTVDRIQEFGFEAGGPAWRDRVWLWASWGQNDINRITGGGQSDRTILEGTAIKLNAQFTAANSFVASFNNGDKKKFGRGASPDKDPSATWNQRGPTGITKIEDTHVFGSNLFLTGQYSFVDGGFSLTSLGGSGPDHPPNPSPGGEQYTDSNGFQTNVQSGGNSRPTEELKIDGSYFFTTSSLNHELKFGGRTREAKTST
ncbi:MAG: TonB-dependent receptor, partial [Thermoanaerobaculia bacterium]